MIPLSLDNKILQFLVFRSQDSQEVNWCNYEIVTAVVHLGPSRKVGHYRVAAFMPGEVGFWYSDDNQPATWTPHLNAEIAEQCYMFGCLRR